MKKIIPFIAAAAIAASGCVTTPNMPEPLKIAASPLAVAAAQSEAETKTACAEYNKAAKANSRIDAVIDALAIPARAAALAVGGVVASAVEIVAGGNAIRKSVTGAFKSTTDKCAAIDDS